MLDYLAYHMAQRRVAELARSALPDSPVQVPEVASHPACPRAFTSMRAATGALLGGLADHLNRSRLLASSPQQTVAEAAPVGPPSRRSPALDRDDAPRPTTDREAMGRRPALELIDM
jgi:hypothetical protein